MALADIAGLAELYDRYANALDRLSPDRLRFRRQFQDRLEWLHAHEGQGVSYEAFRFEAVRLCKEYLKKN